MIKDLSKALGSKIVQPVGKPSPGKPLLDALKSGKIPMIRIPGRNKPKLDGNNPSPIRIGIPLDKDKLAKILTPGSTLK